MTNKALGERRIRLPQKVWRLRYLSREWHRGGYGPTEVRTDTYYDEKSLRYAVENLRDRKVEFQLWEGEVYWQQVQGPESRKP